MAVIFEDAVREQAKLRLGIAGPSGAGKTYSALLIAEAIREATGCTVAVCDSENNSASLYAHLCKFKRCLVQQPYTPEKYIEIIDTAEKAGFGILIIDSLTHEWSGPGGCLEINDNLAKAKYKGNTWSAWNETTPRHRRLLDRIVASPMHIITTLRSKTETVQGDDRKVVKLGMKSEMRDGFEYELTVVFDITHEGHYAMVSKDRTGLFTGKDPKPITKETGLILLDWLNTGVEMKPNTTPENESFKAPPKEPAKKKEEPNKEEPKKPQQTPFEAASEAILNCKTAEELQSLAKRVNTNKHPKTGAKVFSTEEMMELLGLCEKICKESEWDEATLAAAIA